MPLKDFVEETWNALNTGDKYDEYPIGHAKLWWAKTEDGRKELMKLLPQAPAGLDVRQFSQETLDKQEGR
jgi:hypothetical protein